MTSRLAIGICPLTLALACAQETQAAITIPQTKNAGFSAANTTTSVTFTSGIAAGGVIIVAGGFQGLASGVTLSDGHGDTATFAIGPSLDGLLGNVYYAAAFLTAATSATTVTATYTGGTPNFGDIFIWEVDGLTSATIDKDATANGTAPTADSGPTGTLTASAEGAVGYFNISGALTGSPAGVGWTSDGQQAITGSFGEHKILSSNASIDATANTVATTTWRALVVTVKSAGSGSSEKTAPSLMLLGVGN